MANAAKRSAMQAKASGIKTTQTPVVSDKKNESVEKAQVAAAEQKAPSKGRANSIRSIIRAGLLAGTDVKAIAAEVKEKHPNSAAAAKSSRHIGYYASVMRKAGELPKKVKAAPVAEPKVATPA